MLGAMPSPYVPQRAAASRLLTIRQRPLHLLQWPATQPTQPPLVLCHGWMDVGASFQFVVDALDAGFCAQRTIYALDWRGFGRSRSLPAPDHFVFADYLGDLDALLDEIAPGQAVDLLGHSMGGNVVMMYAGTRPERVRRLVNLEGFGMPATTPDQAPARYRRWLDEMRAQREEEADGSALRSYASAAEVAARLRRNNPRLAEDRALWLAGHWSAPDGAGRWRILGDAAHKVASAQLFRADELLALYAAITAPTLVVKAAQDTMQGYWPGRYGLDEFLARIRRVPQLQLADVADAGHMLHHDQPAALARLIEAFLAAPAPH
ncbi:MAG: alpha/beta fold hydrolase [Comamonas sp.]